ncbi:MAG TPA: FAD-dependent monooxygenase [Candidatus Acidoferrum sp.]|nr:FAD-dependent monooxygenase [Candidatus Acidoferrum sp.]
MHSTVGQVEVLIVGAGPTGLTLACDLARRNIDLRLIDIEQDEQGVTATLETEKGNVQVRTKYLVGADGGRSFVRKFMQIGFEGDTWNGAECSSQTCAWKG